MTFVNGFANGILVGPPRPRPGLGRLPHLGAHGPKPSSIMVTWDLAARLRACMRRWHLQSEDRLSGGFRFEVFECTTASGEEVVVKLTVAPEEARAEAAALTAWAHTGAAPRLIDVDFEHRALLLARIRPATPLPGGNDPVAVSVAAGLLSSLHRVNPATFPFPVLEKDLRPHDGPGTPCPRRSAAGCSPGGCRGTVRNH